MTLRRKLIAAILLTCIGSVHMHAQRTEKFRPQYHFSPNSGWIGDPDGLVNYKGLYHLFWWGHATSADMVYWDELPYPIQGDDGNYQVTTGSAVVNNKTSNTLPPNSFVNFHTLVHGAAGVGISTSPDSNAPDFQHFTLYPGNPLFPPPASEFRDPQVFWYAPSNSWVMVVAGGGDRKIYFYGSADLLKWTSLGTFDQTKVTNNTCGSGLVWETPDFFELPFAGSPSGTKWVLSIGVKDRMCYMVGDFNGTSFNGTGDLLPTDAGSDFYAARTWRNYDTPQNRVTMLGWMGNWDYSPVSPSRPVYGGTGASSIPRDLSLKAYPEGIRLVQTPIAELGNELRKGGQSAANVTVTGTHPITDFVPFTPSQNSYEIDATFTVTSAPNGGPAPFGFNLLVDHAANRSLIVRYDPSLNMLSVDRTHSYAVTGNSTFDNNFPRTITASLLPDGNSQIRLHIFIDKSSVEIFTNDGRVVMTLLTYPEDPQPGIEVFANGTTALTSFNAWELNSIWNNKPTNKIQSGGLYKIAARHDGKLLDDPQAGDTHCLQQWADQLGGPNDHQNQHWQIELASPGQYSGDNWVPPYYRFTNQANKDAVDLREGSTSNGTVVQEYQQMVNDDNQLWQIEEIGGNYFKIVSKITATGDVPHEAIEVQSSATGEATNDGQPVQTWQFLAYDHQEWQFILIAPPQP